MDRQERLWRLAEIEAGVECSKIDREPMFGSQRVIDELTLTTKVDRVVGNKPKKTTKVILNTR